MTRGGRASRQSEESISSPSSSPSLPIFSQNKSRGETRSRHHIPALDLAGTSGHHEHQRHSNVSSTASNFNTLSLSDEIINDVFESITAWDEDEVDAVDKHTMDRDQCIAFFEKYIYSTLCLVDEEDVSTLESHKRIIAEAIFEHSCFTNSDEVSFAQFVDAVGKLRKPQFVKALNVYDARSRSRTRSQVNTSLSSHRISLPHETPAHSTGVVPGPSAALPSPLVSIYENTPLTDDQLCISPFEFPVDLQVFMHLIVLSESIMI